MRPSRSLAVPLLAFASGCFTVRGTAGVTVAGDGHAGAFAEARFGPNTSLNDRTGLTYSLSLGGQLDDDGRFTVLSIFGLDLTRQPDGDGTAWNAGARTGIAAVPKGDVTWSWGAHVGVLRSRVNHDTRGRVQSGEGRWFRSWLGVGPSLDLMRSSRASGSELDRWWAQLGLSVDLTQLAQDEAFAAEH